MSERAGSSQATEFEQFFSAARPGLVGQGYLLTGNLAEAQDLAQETLARAWKHWATIRAYEDPGGWARRVLHHLAISRWRRLRVSVRRDAARAVPDVPPPDAGHLDVVAAVNRLPTGQRRTLVLHDFAGLTLEEVARELDVPTGTARGWLFRAHESVAAALRASDVAHDGARAATTTGGPQGG